MTNNVQPTPMLRTTGFWLAAMMAVFQAANAVRSIGDPVQFAGYMGLPLENAADIGFVAVYGLRAGFISLMITILLLRRQLDALAWVALAALVMPIGDAWLTFSAGAPAATVARHGAVAAYVLVAFVFLRRAADRVS